MVKLSFSMDIIIKTKENIIVTINEINNYNKLHYSTLQKKKTN